MNPFSNIVELDKDHPQFNDGKLITLSSQAGHGKTMTSHSLALHYLESNINVLMFYEHERSARCFFHYAKEKRDIDKNFGILAISPVYTFTPIEGFNDSIKKTLDLIPGEFVIIIDGQMFSSNNTFEYTKIKDENTRFVLFEKHNPNLLSSISQEEDRDRFTRARRIAFALKALCNTLKTHIIVTVQESRIDVNSTHTGSLVSDMCFSTKRENPESFIIKMTKSRYSAGNQEIKCQMNENNLTFVTK